MIRILAIESSCDETAAAVIDDGRTIKSNIISTQIPLHTLYGGVVPEIASRKHTERIDNVVRMALREADTDIEDIDAVAVTYGPGLVGALLVGVSWAKAFAFANDKPLVGVNHIEGHISANYISSPWLAPPFLCLVVSGGHTHLVRVTDYGRYEILGRTADDAAGEAFDKVARSIGLGYPGGPKIEAAARDGNPDAYPLPIGHVGTSPYDFSFSGLKSAVLNLQNEKRMKGEAIDGNDLAASFQKAVIDALVTKSMMAVEENNEGVFAVAGGVAANGALREALAGACRERGVRFCYPEPVLCTDNAAMIGAAGYYRYMEGQRDDWDLNAVPNLALTAG